MQHLKICTKKDVLSLTQVRKFETKLGERLQVPGDAGDIEASVRQSSAKFVLIGVPEDIGVKADLGLGAGREGGAWHAFLQFFLNVQSNDFLDGEEILLLGYFDFSDLESVIESNANHYEEKIEAYRHAVNTIDSAVEQLVHIITQNRKMPLVIGGGHNNAYPCIKGAAKGWHKAGVIELAQINAINLDSNSHYQPIEGRHSGNAFRYAEEDGYLQKYCVIGLHENSLPQNTWIDIVNNPFIDCITHEDIFLHEKKSFIEAVSHATAFTDGALCGIELDLDVVESTNAVGISANHARQYLTFVASDCKPAYLHICDGTVLPSDSKRDNVTGKLISYLVTDFAKAILMQLNG
jgi:formiminoglutamase